MPYYNHKQHIFLFQSSFFRLYSFLSCVLIWFGGGWGEVDLEKGEILAKKLIEKFKTLQISISQESPRTFRRLHKNLVQSHRNSSTFFHLIPHLTLSSEPTTLRTKKKFNNTTRIEGENVKKYSRKIFKEKHFSFS